MIWKENSRVTSRHCYRKINLLQLQFFENPRTEDVNQTNTTLYNNKDNNKNKANI